jgi:DnaK suppressor protein
MDEPDDAELRHRYTDRLGEELAAVEAVSQARRADRRPVELDQQSVGRLSCMDAMHGQAMAAAGEVRRQGRVRALRAALSRLDSHEFGWCTACGDFIGLDRLDLDPAMMRCVGCAR